MEWPDTWTSDDGLAFTRVVSGWQVDVVREIPARLGEPCGVELPHTGAIIEEGAMLMAIELSKARVEFSAPARVTVCESRNLSVPNRGTKAAEVLWSLVISPGNS